MLLSKFGDWAIIISIFLAIIAILVHRLFPYSIWCISVGMTALPFVSIGYWLRKHNVSFWAVLLCIVLWIIDIIYSRLGMYDMQWDCYPLNLIGALGGSFCFYYICKFIKTNFNILSKILSILGTWSLAIMCIHDIEMHCHLGNHVMALFPFVLPIWGKYIFRYLLTITLAFIVVKTPIIKKIFV